MVLGCSFLLLIVLDIAKSDGNIEIISSFGRMKGIEKAINNGSTKVYEFLKIPYAKPPVGKLRFQKPQPHDKLSGLYDATKFGPSCMQNITIANMYEHGHLKVSEDCLHLNVYVPHDLNTILRPVMVWIHGGGWYLGQGTTFDGSALATVGDVIVITINYRLGFFGFMTTLNDQFPGNYGLYDCLEAIRWTKNHIASFGGDPNKITLFGQSAGAFNVMYLATSPLSKGLFQHAILESGGDLRPYVLEPTIKNHSYQVIKRVGCLNITDGMSIPTDAIQCLQDVNAEMIVRESAVLRESSNESLPLWSTYFRPSIDGELIQDVPEQILKNTSSASFQVFNSIDILQGINSGEGESIVSYSRKLQNKYNFSLDNGIPTEVLCKELIPSVVRQFYNSNDRISQALCGAYTNSGGLEEQGRSAIDFMGDLVFAYPMQQILDFHSKFSSRGTYQYLFTKVPSYRMYPVPSWFLGVNHGEEISCVFGLTKVANYTHYEHNLCRTVMEYWTNFAKTGNPNSGNDGNLIWPSYKNRNAYIDFGDKLRIRHDLFRGRMVVWEKTIPALHVNFILSHTDFNVPFGK
ncbi:hypothetical protein FSP39_000808 [Pinctada imbricata]|uniref:Carboxylic ester hydrolase n=1 Tax=Pinctada imbricata TaxID=66713 RepID=A0AA88Y9Z2_PINIB|nr:hypothetical protein FSP39_000808 [Pinctada imbricata]